MPYECCVFTNGNLGYTVESIVLMSTEDHCIFWAELWELDFYYFWLYHSFLCDLSLVFKISNVYFRDAVRLKFYVCARLYFPSVRSAVSAKYLCHLYFKLVCDTTCFLFTFFLFLTIAGLVSFIFFSSSSNAVWCILCHLLDVCWVSVKQLKY